MAVQVTFTGNPRLPFKTRIKITLSFDYSKLEIIQLQIHNLYSYNEAQKIKFSNYNIIVGSNASGKTNLARILEFIRDPRFTINEKRLALDIKFDRMKSSYLQVNIRLNPEEARMLLELLFDKTVDDSNYDENMSILSISLEWTKIYEENRTPSKVILYFNNHLILWTDDAYVNVSYVRVPLEDIDKIKSDIQEARDIDNNQHLKEEYLNQKGFAHTDLFNQEKFQNCLISNDRTSDGNLRNFFEINDARIQFKMQPFVVTFNPGRTDEENAHAVRILSYLGIKYPSPNSANIWLLVSRFLEKMTIQKEVRPNFEDLAKEFVRIKDSNLDRYNSIVKEFSDIFPNSSFDAISKSEIADTNNSITKPTIWIKERDPYTGLIYRYYLQDSASGYNELLYLILQKTQNEDNILILDEPALHLHPNRIRHLNRLLTGSTRQMILITHSPYFVDVSTLGIGRNLIYIKREHDRASRVVSKSDNQSVQMKSYVFDPNVFFSNHNILVEGAGDAASFFAISDSLNSIFEKYNITVINAGGDGNIDAYIKLMDFYHIPYVAMVDNQYRGINKASEKFVRLKNKLESELKTAGWKGSVDSSIDPNVAYEFVFNAIQTGNAKKIRSIQIGNIFDKVLTSIGEVPDNIWKFK